MSKKRRAARVLRRRPRSWLGIVCLLLTLAGILFSSYETDSEGKITNLSQVFAAFADLNLGADTVAKMRESPLPPSSKPAQTPWRVVTKVLDGDTVRLDNGETVRLLGIDTPESSENRKLREDVYKLGRAGFPVREQDMALLGQSATAFVKELAEGRRCWLEHEKEPRDSYGRLLAYIHLEDGRVLNELILSHGYAKAYLNFPFRYRKRYILLQNEARLRRRGLWKDN